ncbi:MAG: hypothetical protein JNL11_19685 [Bdellovibrionaceae bacterium]|nr:hypothetical protein [Pseudobdellovibrionaceae bacterium]
MKLPMKQWFLYGTLFSVLGFSLSGHDPRVEGSTHLSQLAPATASPAASNATNTGSSTAPAVEHAAATVVTTTPAPARGGADSSASGRTVTPAPKPEKFNNYSLYVKSTGKTYEVQMLSKNDQTQVIYFDKNEGRNCTSSECNRTAAMHIIDGESADDFRKILAKIEFELIPQDEAKIAKKETASSEDSDKDSDGTSDGRAYLDKTIDKRCKNFKDEILLIDCKVSKFMDILKENKKQKNKKKFPEITDDDAKSYVSDELKTKLKDMLTHKHSVRTLGRSAYGLNLEDRNFIFEEKEKALLEMEKAKNMIAKLLRLSVAGYDETKKEITSLYKESMREQANIALRNLREMSDAKAADNMLGFAKSRGSFMENYNYLGYLDRELYSSMDDNLRWAMSSDYLGDSFGSNLLDSLYTDRESILKAFLNERTQSLGSNPLLQGLDAVTNAGRRGRGTGTTASGLSTGLPGSSVIINRVNRGF